MRAALVFIVLMLWAQVSWAQCISSEGAALRSGPSKRSEKLWQGHLYMPLIKLESKKGWLRVVDVDGDTYWVDSQHVTDDFKCAVLTQDGATIYSGPGSGNPAAPWGPAKKYSVFKVLGDIEGWLNVQDEEGREGWFPREQLWVQ